MPILCKFYELLSQIWCVFHRRIPLSVIFSHYLQNTIDLNWLGNVSLGGEGVASCLRDGFQQPPLIITWRWYLPPSRCSPWAEGKTRAGRQGLACQKDGSSFFFYTKSMKPKRTILESSANPEQQKNTTLTQKCIRWLRNTRKQLSCTRNTDTRNWLGGKYKSCILSLPPLGQLVYLPG